MKPSVLPGLSGLFLCLTACGDGGGSSSVASTPAPAPSPTPTPASSQALTPSFTPSETLAGATATVRPVGNTGAVDLLDASSVSIARDSTGNYFITLPMLIPTLTDQASGSSQSMERRFEFLASNRTTTASGAQQYVLGRSNNLWGNEKSFLTVLPAKTAANPLSYLNFASLVFTFADTVGPADPSVPGGSVLVFGDRTVQGDLPLSGTASYTGTFATSYASRAFSVSCPECDGTSGGGFATAGQLAGNMRLSVNFADKSVSGSLSNIADSTGWFSYGNSDLNHRIADLAMTGSFNSGGTFSGAIAASANTPFTGGSWNGMFFGPQAAELGGSMVLRASIFGLPTGYDGYFGGKKD